MDEYVIIHKCLLENKLEKIANDTKDKIQELKEDMKEKIEDMKEKIQELKEDTKDKIQELKEDTKDKIQEDRTFKITRSRKLFVCYQFRNLISPWNHR